MRNTEKDRAKRNQRKHKVKGVKINCRHLRRTVMRCADLMIPITSGLLVCLDCGEPIRMLANTVFGTSLDPSAKRNEAHRKNG
jgi:hypothetical protein